MIDLEYLQRQKEHLKRQEDEQLGILHRIRGAMQQCQHLIDVLESQEAAKTEPQTADANGV